MTALFPPSHAAVSGLKRISDLVADVGDKRRTRRLVETCRTTGSTNPRHQHVARALLLELSMDAVYRLCNRPEVDAHSAVTATHFAASHATRWSRPTPPS